MSDDLILEPVACWYNWVLNFDFSVYYYNITNSYMSTTVLKLGQCIWLLKSYILLLYSVVVFKSLYLVNDCFANVVLQCLSFTMPLIAFLLEKGHHGECNVTN